MMPALVAMVLTLTPAAPAGIAPTADALPGPRVASALPAPSPRTAKERLVNKASDDQRVNNCKVPVALRGPKARPDGCRAGGDRAPTQ